MRNIQVNMQFNADTSNAQSQIQQLQSTLKSIATTHVNVQGGSIDQAVHSAQMLSQHLTAATNVNTGKIDFTKLQMSLKSSNTDLTTLTNNLLAMGPKGQQAFSQVANAVAHAELSMKKTNTTLAALGTTLMNTIKWQAASTLIHGVMSAFSSAVGHIEKLDKALNNIQIVTGKTSAEMAGFAKRAQALSKELHSTTEEYAKASLIFYQQGLGEEQVLKRTEATIKMAKVTGEAVQTVSDQLTAIWNNFDNGSQSLEYYVDVITALGAATASSTSEISDGLQKFAAIAETVGLSYEYAATALATVTAETRQSADVVGTAFKTLFARMEGLKLGETLDDGTTLNQYSQAMAKAGINIKDANGNLKDMDVILDEMGSKWQNLNKDQQVALAQQVGGIRQYNQLIALMDNWDTFKINLEIAEDSEGTLDKQMEVYQTSVEASEKALQNAKETLYETLFNSEMLKDFNNGLADILEMFTRIVDKAGGLQGLLKFGGLLLLKTLLPNLMGFVTKITGSISNVIGLTKKQKINEVDNLSKTQKKIAGQDDKPGRGWGGKTDRAAAKFQKAQMLKEKEDPSKHDLKKAESLQKKGVKAASKLVKKENAIGDHEQKAKNARSMREEENEARARIGKKPKSEGFGERWHRRRAEGMEERATTEVSTRNTLGVKSDQLPSTKMNTSGTAGQMADSIGKEQAGYTAAILDSKKEYLILEDSLTEKQKAQYKNYEDQINAENDLLRIARERQLVSKEAADESSKNATAAVEMSDAGEDKVGEVAKAAAKKNLGLEDFDKRKRDSDMHHKGVMDKLKYEEEQLGEEQEGEDPAKAQKRADIKKKRAEEESRYTKANAKFKKEEFAIQQEADRIVSSDANFAKRVDMGGEETAKMAAKMQKQTGATSIANEKTGAVTQVQTAQAATMESMQAELTPGDSGAPAVSVENLEKLGALQGQYNTDAQVAVDLQGELGTAIGVAGDKTKKGTKEYEAGNKSLKQAGQFAQKYGKEVGAAADEMAASGKYTDKQIQAVRTLAKEGAQVDLENMDPQDLAAIQAALGKVEGGLTKAGAAAAQMADGMADDMANATGATKDTFTAVSAGAQQLATDTANADQQAVKLQTTMQQPVPVQPDPYGGLVMGAQGAMQAITSMAMGAQMLSMGLQTAFDPDATGIEKLTGWMMIMQGAQSLLNLTTAAGNIVNGISNVIGAIAIGIKEKGFGAWLKEIALKGLDTAATLVNAVAKVFNAEASKGLAGVIIGILAAALIIGTIAMVANTVKTEQSTKAAQENADKKKAQAEGAREAAEAAREELDAVIELTNAYMDALKIYEETGEGKEELRKAAFEAIDAMNLEGHELEVLAGNYANLTKEIQKYNAVKAGKAVGASSVSLSSGGAAMLAMENVEGTGGLWTTTEGSKKYLTLSLNEEDKTNDSGDALHRWLAVNDSPWTVEGSGNLKAEYTDSSQIPYLMKEFYRLYDGVAAIATASEQENMAFFSEAQEMRDSGTWDYGQEIAATYDTHTDTAVTAAKATQLVDVDSQAEYNKAYQQMVEYALEAHGLKEEASKAYEDMSAQAKAVVDSLNTDLSKDENWTDFELKRRGLSSFEKGGTYENSAAASYYSEKDSSGKTALEKWAEENDIDPDDAIDLFLKINPQFINNETEIQQALDRMQDYLDSQTLIVKYDLVKGAQSALKEQMSSSDWSNFYDQYKDLFDPESESYIGIGFKEFTEKSYSERQALLNAAKGSTSEELNNQAGILEGNLDTYLDSDYKENYITGKKEEFTQDYNDEVAAVREEAQTEYSGDMIKDFTNANYLSEATRWNKGIGVEGGMTQAEYDSIDSWAMKTYNMTGSQYLDAKWNYLNAMNGQNGNDFGSEFNINNLVKAPEDVDARAEAAYDDFISGQKTAIQATKDEAHLASLEELDKDIERYELDTEEVYTYAEALEDLPLVESREEAVKLAIANSRVNKGVEELSSNFEDWSTVLKSGEKGNQKYATSLKGLKNAVADILDSDPTQLTEDFLTSAETLALLEKVAEGDAEALAELQKQAALNITSQIEIDVNDEELSGKLTEINTWISDFPDLEVGASLDSTGMTSALQALLDAGVVTVDQMNAILNNIGFEPEITYKEMTVKEAKAAKQTAYLKTDNGEYTQVTDEVKLDDTAKVWVPMINGKNTSYQGPPKTTLNQTKDSGGGGEKKKADKVKKSDVVERYKEVDDSLEKVADAMEDASKAMDRLYGVSRLKQMEKQNALIQNEIKLLKQKKNAALQYLEEDRKAMAEAAKEAGINLELDTNGLITNYTEAMAKIYKELDAAITAANKDGNADESEQEKIDAIQKRADDLQAAIDQYDETRTTIEDLNNQLDDKFYEWQDNNAEMLSYKLELKIEINDMELESLEYELSKIEDDFYSMAEAAALMVNANASTTGTSQLGVYKQELADYTDQITALNNAYNEIDPSNSEISQAAYIEGLKEAKSGIIENLQALQELDKSMIEYYGNTLDMAAEEIAKYTDRMDHQTAVLDHYSSLLEIMGKSNDYKTMGKELEGKAKTIGDQAAVAKKTMEMYKGQAADRLAEYQQALASGDEAAAELYLKQYEAALAAANEAEDNYLSKAEEWAEALKAVLENKLADLADTLEDALTGGTSFDSIATSMERASSLQEEYLTTTNKIYETNKMINTAQKEIDKTTNTVAKQRLKNFQQEISQLQNKSKLSQYELDIQQTKYDLLLAEIALEEAQQAKSTVRLRRDSEGNFGYVYTADANAISDAEQKVADAQNTLYNKGLEGANDYVQKYQETMSEMYDTLKEIQEQYLNGEFETEEEYHREMEKAKEYYFQKLQDYSSLYQVALTTDSRVVADAWSTDFADMAYNTGQWQKDVDDYIKKVKGEFADWQTQIQQISQDTSLDTLEENIKDITDESEKLKETIIGENGVINAIEKEIDAVSNITSEYATLRNTLQALMGDYEDLGKSIDESVRKQQLAEAGVSSNTSTFNSETIGGTGSGGKGSGGDPDGKGPAGPGTEDLCPKCGKNKKDCKCGKNITKVYPVKLAADPYGYVKMGQVDAKSINGEKDFTIKDLKTGTSYGYKFDSKKGSGYITKEDYDHLNSFDTGGYTGSWGNEGKLAMLHQKELVLNPEDTTNFLASLEVLREIISVINLHSMNAQLAGLLSTPYYTNNTETQMLEQQVHIEASFPNVQDRHEIEDAFNNLINRAAQFVNRK